MQLNRDSVLPPGVCPTATDRVLGPNEPLSNVVAVRQGRIFWNDQNVRVAMSPKRIRIGCTEVSIEAAREIMAHHAERFGKPEPEMWEEVQ